MKLSFGYHLNLWILTLYANLVKPEEFNMEDGAGEFAMEGNVVGQVSVPNYVHPNTHISGYSETHLYKYARFFVWPSAFIEILVF